MKNKKILKLSLILIGSGLITSSLMAVKINTVVDQDQYPINKSIASINHGGDLPDKVAAIDGMGTILLGKIGNKITGDNGINNSDYNKLVKDNVNKLDDTITFNDLITGGNIDISKYPKINENKFIDHSNNIIGANCDDNDPNTKFDKIQSDGTCQGTVCNTTNNKTALENKILAGKDVSNFNTSCITDMSNLFYDIYQSNSTIIKNFHQDISNQDVSNVTNMINMFYNASNFNKPLNSWDVSNVTNMSYMFFNAYLFNKPLNSWDVSNVRDMRYMFVDTYNFNQDISGWDVSNIINYNYFRHNSALTTANSPSQNGTKF